MKESLYKKLERYGEEEIAPFHMPGHKRRGFEDCPTLAAAASVDITEIDGFDDLSHPCGVIGEIERKGEELYGSKRCFLSTNGSTGGILAAIRTAGIMGKREGKSKIAIARNCHRSVYNGVELSGLTPCYLLPEMLGDWGCYGSVSPQSAEELFEKEKGICALVITSPTYEGVVSDIEEIARVAHRNGAILIVDEAHGSHLPFMYRDIKSAVALGGDIVINSLHKTMAALTQASAVHVGKESRVDVELLAGQIRVFNTTSPSYPVMASVDHCFDMLSKDGKARFGSLLDDICLSRKRLGELKRLKLLCECDGIFALDVSKTVILSCGAGMSGYGLADLLRKNYKIECESANMNSVIAMTGENTSLKDLERLTDALLEIDLRADGGEREVKKTFISALPAVRLSPEEALYRKSRAVSVKSAIGRVSAEYLWIYPPGIPFLVPGEVIDNEALDIISNYGGAVISQRCDGEFDGMVAVVC